MFCRSFCLVFSPSLLSFEFFLKVAIGQPYLWEFKVIGHDLSNLVALYAESGVLLCRGKIEGKNGSQTDVRVTF